MTMTVQETLAKAADHIERVGLFKGDFFKGVTDAEGYSTTGVQQAFALAVADAPCCTYGAIYVASGGNEYLAVRAADALAESLGVDDIPDWNDKPSQRKGRVVAALRKVAGVTA